MKQFSIKSVSKPMTLETGSMSRKKAGLLHESTGFMRIRRWIWGQYCGETESLVSMSASGSLREAALEATDRYNRRANHHLDPGS